MLRKWKKKCYFNIKISYNNLTTWSDLGLFTNQKVKNKLETLLRHNLNFFESHFSSTLKSQNTVIRCLDIMMIIGKATKIRQPSVQSNLVFQGLKNRLRKEKKKKRLRTS